MNLHLSGIERSAGSAARIAYVDNLRWLVIIMVVVVHTFVTYSGIGSWFYVEPARLDVASTLTFVSFQAFSQAFFMGLLFLIAGTFVPKAYDRKGFGRFMLDRVVRLGIPTLVFILILDPTIQIIRTAFRGEELTLGLVAAGYARYLSSVEIIGHTGPLWFALALLVFTSLYGLVRATVEALARRAPATPRRSDPARIATHRTVVAVVSVIAVCTFAVRLVQPCGTAWFNMQLCYFSQYVVLFLVGLWIGRRELLSALPVRLGKRWLMLAVAAGVPVWFLLLGFGGALAGSLEPYGGGWHWQAAAYAAWESFVGVGMSLGLIVLYRERANRGGPIARFLSRNCFGVYCFHAPILVAIAMAAAPIALYPLLKAALVGLAAIAASYLLAAIVRAIPGLGRIFA